MECNSADVIGVIKTISDDFRIISIQRYRTDEFMVEAVNISQYTKVKLKVFRLSDEPDFFDDEEELDQNPDEPQLSDEDLDKLWDALKKNQSIKLQVRMEFSDGKMKSGTILAIY